MMKKDSADETKIKINPLRLLFDCTGEVPELVNSEFGLTPESSMMNLTNHGDGIPRFSMPMVLMQSVLVPDYSNHQNQVKPALPILSRRVCPKSPPSSATNNNHNINTCRLPFKDGDALSGYTTSSIGRKFSSKPLLSSSNKMISATSKIEKERTDATKRLNQKLHAEHRVFMENLKIERESTFQTRTIAAMTIQRYIRGLAVRIKMNPCKYAALRASLETHFTIEELSKLVDDAIRRAGVTLP